MKRLFIKGCALLLSGCVLLSLAACGDGNMEKINDANNNYKAAKTYEAGSNDAITFEVLGGEEVMPLGVFYGPYGLGNSSSASENGIVTPDYLTDEIFKLLKDSGVNFIGHSQDQ